MSKQPAAAIVGIGATEFSKNSGRTELKLAVEACLAALDDAGIEPLEVDGFVSFHIDNSDESVVARNLGTGDVTFFAKSSWGGGGGPGTVALAAMAIETGRANVVVCYRAMNERSQQRFGQPMGYADDGVVPALAVDMSWGSPFGMVTPASQSAHSARRYLHQYGATSEDFGRQAVVQREYARTNPVAFFRDRPLTLADHQASRMIADPLRLFDCCQESDGAVAIVLTSAERAKGLRRPPVGVLGAAMGMAAQTFSMASPYRDDIAGASESSVVAEQLYAQAGLRPSDIDVAILYDHFSPAVLMQLEAYGFCGPGEAPGLIRDGGTRIDGVIPTNTNGGQLSEGYIHGFNGMAEAVRQLRGTAANQVPGATHALATGGSHVPTSGVLLGRMS